MAVTENNLIEAAVEVGLIAEKDLRDLRVKAKRERLRLLEIVTRTGRFPEAALYQALADVRGIPFLQSIQLVADKKALDKLPRALRQRQMLPIRAANGEHLLALTDPDDRLSLERVIKATGQNYSPALCEPEALQAAIKKDSGRQGADLTTADALTGEYDPVELLDHLMKEVYLRRVSDVHFEPQEDGMRIRLRVDGHMQEYSRYLNRIDEEALMNRVKVLAGLDIAEQRMAQDGAMKYTISDWNLPETDIRVATIPTRWGERGTMRILGQETGDLSLKQLGMPKEMLTRFGEAITRPHGMILVTGPTGSGKSTTLYAAIRELEVDTTNILTVEDPVEQTIEGISQVQVGTKIDFAQALRSFLRHDPDVILVGEIRDKETVDIGLRAAMTGHLVMSTLHTNDSVGAVTRLADIGAERFLIGSTLVGVLAQRLARRLCRQCRRPRPASLEELQILGLAEKDGCEIFEPQGCSFCLGSGFKGRIGIFEALWISSDLRKAVAEGAGEATIKELATSLTTLWQDACSKVLRGDVSLAEVLHLRPEA